MFILVLEYTSKVLEALSYIRLPRQSDIVENHHHNHWNFSGHSNCPQCRELVLQHQVHPVYPVRTLVEGVITHHERTTPKSETKLCCGSGFVEQSHGENNIGDSLRSARPDTFVIQTELTASELPTSQTDMSIQTTTSHTCTSTNDQSQQSHQNLTSLRNNLSELEDDLASAQQALTMNQVRSEAMHNRMDSLQTSIREHSLYTRQLLEEGRSITREIQLHRRGNIREQTTYRANTDDSVPSYLKIVEKDTINSLIHLISFNLTSFPHTLIDKSPDQVLEQILELSTGAKGYTEKRDAHLLVATAFASCWFSKEQRIKLRKLLLARKL